VKSITIKITGMSKLDFQVFSHDFSRSNVLCEMPVIYLKILKSLWFEPNCKMGAQVHSEEII
jgi:hypothetical protein